MKHATLLAAAALALACADEELRQLTPHISLCPSDTSAAVDCDGTIDLGDLHVEVQDSAQVFIVNRGDGRLAVGDASFDDSALAAALVPESVAALGAAPLPITTHFDVAALGPGSTVLSVASSDADRAVATVELVWNGIPAPQSDILLCDGAEATATCGAPLVIDFGVVRPTQATSKLILVKNVGEDPLTVFGARVEGDAAFTLGSSSAGGEIAPGGSASMVVVYGPAAAGASTASLIIDSDDRDTPAAVVTLSGTGGANLPPVATCVESLSGAASAAVRVGDRVGIDGTGSRDPEGDPLAFAWSLSGPAGSSAAIEDAGAQSALFIPDARGAWTVTLVVTDSLGQASAPCAVALDAAARFGFRARVRWDAGGDVDLHLVEAGSVLFSVRDVRYDNRTLATGGAGTADDVELVDDATAAPGAEQIVIGEPAAGTWEVWVQLFDDAELGAVDATVEIIVDDTLPPVYVATRQLPATCALWHVAVVDLPSATVTPVDTTATQCF